MKPLVHCRLVLALIALPLAAAASSAQMPAAQTQAVSPATPNATQQNTISPPAASDASAAAAASSQQHVAPLALKVANTAAAPSDADRATAQSSSSADAMQLLHLIVGRSLFLEFPERLRRVYVSNPAVLDAMTASAFELVITAKAPGTSSLVLWAATGPAQVYTVLSDVDVAGLSQSLADALPGDHIEVEAQQGRIHLTGVVASDAAADEAAKLAGIYSKDVVNSLVVDPRHLPQVQLEVKIAEIDRSKLTAFGINLLGLNGTSMGQGSTEQFSPFTFQSSGGTTQAITSDFLNLWYFNIKNGVGATIKDLENKGILEILAEPNLTTIHGNAGSASTHSSYCFKRWTLGKPTSAFKETDDKLNALIKIVDGMIRNRPQQN